MLTLLAEYEVCWYSKLTLYTSLVQSQLEYGSVIWAPTTKHNVELLERIQRKSTRYICNYGNLDYKERLQRTKLIPLTSRRESLDYQFAHNLWHKARAGLLGQEIQNICSVRPARHNMRLDSNSNKIHIKKFKTETYAHFYSNRLPPIWNMLPNHIRSLPYVPYSTLFKKSIKKVYISRLETNFDWNNPCTWVTKCRCPTCRV